MIGLRPRHLITDVIQPTLAHLGDRYASSAAQQLLLGTALAESQLLWLHQLGGGPALGLWQMEPTTHAGHVEWCEMHEPGRQVLGLLIGPLPPFMQLAGNLYYACAMARVHYWRVPAPLPELNDVYGMAAYWKEYYNTNKGKGTIFHYVQTWYEAYDNKWIT